MVTVFLQANGFFACFYKLTIARNLVHDALIFKFSALVIYYGRILSFFCVEISSYISTVLNFCMMFVSFSISRTPDVVIFDLSKMFFFFFLESGFISLFDFFDRN